MIELLFVIIVALGILFTILTFADPDEIAWPTVAIIVWFIAAISVFNLEWLVSVVNSSGDVTTSVVSYTDGWPLSLLFILIALFNILFVWFRAMEKFRKVAK
jgi:hypothetical protein